MKKPQPLPVLPPYDKTHVGRRFAMLRAARRMNPTQWAAAIGEKCTPQKIWNYERGEDQVPIHYAARACILTGANFDYIYRGLQKDLPASLRKKLQIAELVETSALAKASGSRR